MQTEIEMTTPDYKVFTRSEKKNYFNKCEIKRKNFSD